jgi:hypothetical protein
MSFYSLFVSGGLSGLGSQSLKMLKGKKKGMKPMR